MFVHYFVRLRTNHYTLLTISTISFIFDSARNLTRHLLYHPLWHFVKIPITWRERRNARYEKSHLKVAIRLSFLAFQTCSCTISWDCEPITIHFSQYRQFRSSLILRGTWQETCCIVHFGILWNYQSPGENGEMRDKRNDWRDSLQNGIYTLLVSLILPTFFCVFVNLTISV